MVTILIVLAIALPWLGAALIAATSDRYPRLQQALAVGFSIGGAAAALALIPRRSDIVVTIASLGPAFGALAFLADGLGLFLAVIATAIGSLAVIFSIDYMRGEEQLGRYYAFVLFFIGAMVGLVLSSGLLLMFVFWEITALCSYALISFHNDDPKAVAGGIKALIVTQVGGVGLLAGALLCYAYLGTYDIPAIVAGADRLPPGILSIVAFGFLAAAAAKSAQFPFHTWLPDAMEAPTPVSALIHAATMVNAGVYLLARFYPAFATVPGWRMAVLTVGLITAVMAALMAATSNDLKRVLAHSTVSQLGYMVYAIGAGGVFAGEFHLLSHAIFKALLFLSAGAVIHAVHTRDMREMGGLRREMPLVTVVMIGGALALAGIPVANGFWSKELVLEAGEAGGPGWAHALMVGGAGLTALYTVRLIAMVFYGEPRRHAHDAGRAMQVALVPLAVATMVSWTLAGPFAAFLGHVSGEPATTRAFVVGIATAPATAIALAVIAAGAFAWRRRDAFTPFARAFGLVEWASARSFGFEPVNRWIAGSTQDAAEVLRATHTGVLNWNVVAVVAALAAVLGVLAM